MPFVARGSSIVVYLPLSDDLTLVVDPVGLRELALGIAERGVAAAAIKEAIAPKETDDLALVVDAVGVGVRGQGNVECGVFAATVEEAVVAAAVCVETDDLSRAVDAVGNGRTRGQGLGIVQRGVGIDRLRPLLRELRQHQLR